MNFNLKLFPKIQKEIENLLGTSIDHDYMEFQ